MSTFVKLLLPLGLGIAAAGLNFAAYYFREAPKSYVALKAPIAEGKPLPADFAQVSLTGRNLSEAFVPWEKRDTLAGRPASRDLAKGDLVLWRDVYPPAPKLKLKPQELALHISLEGLTYEPSLLVVDNEVGFIVDMPGAEANDGATADGEKTKDRLELVGPFRILSVGARLQSQAAGDGAARGAVGKNITVAIRRLDDQQLSDEARRLVEAKAAHERSQGGIQAIVLY